MRKEAARYASDPSITIQGGGMPSFSGMPNVNRMSALLGMGNNSNIARAQQYSGKNNPLSNISIPKIPLATEEGINQVAQKVADYSCSHVPILPINGTFLNPIDLYLDSLLVNIKSGEVTTGEGNSPGIGLQTTQNNTNSTSHKSNNTSIKKNILPKPSILPNSTLSLNNNWNILKPTLKLAMMTPGPANMQPTPGLTANMPPPPQMPPMPPSGQQPMPPQQGMPPGAQPMPQPPMPPMSEPPPQPLPSNPRVNPPSPKTSLQAQQEANILSLLESKQKAENPHSQYSSNQDLQAQNLALSKSAQSKKYFLKLSHNKEERALHLPASHYKLLNKEVLEGKQNWLPRLFPGEHTPAKDTLADPVRNAILSSLLGGGLGALGGYGVSGLTDTSPLTASAVGSGIGALSLGLPTLVHRSNKNDEIADKMRFLPPNPTVRELNKLSSWDVNLDDNNKQTLSNSDLGKLSLLSLKPSIPASLLGGLLGTFHGINNKNIPEGLGRGIIRGGLTGAGLGMGNLAGSLLANKISPDLTSLGGLAGGGLGGQGAYLLGGKVLGKPSSKKEEEKYSLDKCSLLEPPLLNKNKKEEKLGITGNKVLNTSIISDSLINTKEARFLAPAFNFAKNLGKNMGAVNFQNNPLKGTMMRSALGGSLGAWTGSAMEGNNPSGDLTAGFKSGPGMWGGMLAGAAMANPYLRRSMVSRFGAKPVRTIFNPLLGAGGGAAVGDVVDTGAGLLGYNTQGRGAQIGGMAGGLLSGGIRTPLSRTFAGYANKAAVPAMFASAGLAGLNTIKPLFNKYVPPDDYGPHPDFDPGNNPPGFEPLNKTSAQLQDNSHTPKRSASGESKGLSFNNKKEDYSTGLEAWQSVNSHFKSKPNPFTGDHKDSKSTFEKQAFNWRSPLEWGMNLLGRGAKAVPQAAKTVAQEAKPQWQATKSWASRMAPAAQAAPQATQELAQGFKFSPLYHGVQPAFGAAGGWHAPSEWDENASWAQRLPMAALGAATSFGKHPAWEKSHWGAIGHPARGYLYGGGLGSVVGGLTDWTAGRFGYDTDIGNTLYRLGSIGGGIGGLGRGTLPSLARIGKPFESSVSGGVRGALDTTGKYMGQFGKGVEELSNMPLTWGQRMYGKTPMPMRALKDIPLPEKLGITAGGLYMGGSALGTFGRNVDNKAASTFSNLYNQAAPVMARDFTSVADHWLAQRGLLDSQGKVNLTQNIGSNILPKVNNLLSHTDPIFHLLGMNPNTMHPLQKLLILGGGAGVGGGLLAHSPLLTGLGGLSLLGGITPNVRNTPTPNYPNTNTGQEGNTTLSSNSRPNELDLQRQTARQLQQEVENAWAMENLNKNTNNYAQNNRPDEFNLQRA